MSKFINFFIGVSNLGNNIVLNLKQIIFLKKQFNLLIKKYFIKFMFYKIKKNNFYFLISKNMIFIEIYFFVINFDIIKLLKSILIRLNSKFNILFTY